MKGIWGSRAGEASYGKVIRKTMIPKSLLDIYPEKKNVQKCTCTPVFIAAVFTIAKMWKQPKCPLTEEWIKKMW